MSLHVYPYEAFVCWVPQYRSVSIHDVAILVGENRNWYLWQLNYTTFVEFVKKWKCPFAFKFQTSSPDNNQSRVSTERDHTVCEWQTGLGEIYTNEQLEISCDARCKRVIIPCSTGSTRLSHNVRETAAVTQLSHWICSSKCTPWATN